MTVKRIAATEVPPGSVTGVGDYAVGNNGEYFAVGRRCRHLRADLAEGSIDADGPRVPLAPGHVRRDQR